MPPTGTDFQLKLAKAFNPQNLAKSGSHMSHIVTMGTPVPENFSMCRHSPESFDGTFCFILAHGRHFQSTRKESCGCLERVEDRYFPECSAVVLYLESNGNFENYILIL